jgi:hypothetical protein
MGSHDTEGNQKRQFDEALKRLLNTPPDHKARKKSLVPKEATKKGKSTK